MSDIDEDGRAMLDCVRPRLAEELDALRAVEAAARTVLDILDNSRARAEIEIALGALDVVRSRRG